MSEANDQELRFGTKVLINDGKFFKYVPGVVTALRKYEDGVYRYTVNTMPLEIDAVVTKDELTVVGQVYTGEKVKMAVPGPVVAQRPPLLVPR